MELQKEILLGPWILLLVKSVEYLIVMLADVWVAQLAGMRGDSTGHQKVAILVELLDVR
jgi:hypothetical protein